MFKCCWAHKAHMKARFCWVPICDPWAVGMEKSPLEIDCCLEWRAWFLPMKLAGLCHKGRVCDWPFQHHPQCPVMSWHKLSVDEPVQGSSIIGVRLGRSSSSRGLIRGSWLDIGIKAQRALSKPLSSPDSVDHLVHSSLYYHYSSDPKSLNSLGQRSEEQAFSTFTLWVFGFVAKSGPALTTLCTVALRFLCPWDFLGRNAGVGCRFLLQWIFGAEWFFSLGACPGYCRMFSCLPGLYPLDASSTSWSKLFPGVVKCPPEGRGQNLALLQTAEALCL